MSGPSPKDPAERFWEKVQKTDGCWLWTAYVTSEGYGQFKADGRDQGAHRWVYEHLVGPIPEGLHIDHLCRVRRCVNPAHMEPVTSVENLRRGRHANRDKTHCKRGHPLEGDNVYIGTNDSRQCRVCMAIRSRRSKLAQYRKKVPNPRAYRRKAVAP